MTELFKYLAETIAQLPQRKSTRTDYTPKKHKPGRQTNAPVKDYKKYLLTPAWKKRADACKDRADYRCQVCNRGAGVVHLEAHHRTYERLGRELPGDLTALCEDCHELFSKHGRLAKYGTEATRGK